MTEPFLRWAGGKTRLLHELLPRLPIDIGERRYVEPFLGGGALFFAISPKEALLSDVNPHLIATYQTVKHWPKVLSTHLCDLADKHENAPEETYYTMRDAWNGKGKELAFDDRAATFIYLNKTCFNGLHRVNGSGEFNVPFGKRGFLPDIEGILAAHKALQRAELVCADFETTLAGVMPQDFVYLDPPYEPASETSSFTAYAGAFGPDDQARVARAMGRLSLAGVPALASNHDTSRTRTLYRGLRIEPIDARRSIGATIRESAREILVRTY